MVNLQLRLIRRIIKFIWRLKSNVRTTMKESENDWIENGYRTFAIYGPAHLKIEPLARKVGRNKSSFYHHFGDIDSFISILLGHHISQSRIIAEKELKCTGQEDFINILVAHKTDLLFNRQLRIHRDVDIFQKCIFQADEISLPAFLPVWKSLIGLPDQSHLAELVLQLTVENFYLQITEETIHHDWLNHYLNNIRSMVKHFVSVKK